MIAFILFIGFVFFVWIVKATADTIVSQNENPQPPTINIHDNRVDNRCENNYYDNRIIVNHKGKNRSFIYDPKNDYYIEE